MTQPRLLLDLPGGWTPTEEAGGVCFAAKSGCQLFVPFLEPLPVDLAYWSGQVPEHDFPDGAVAVTVTNRFDRTTALGWKLAISESVVTGSGGLVIEARLHAVVIMLEHGAIVAAYASSPDELAAHRDEILGTLDSVRPDWGHDPSAYLRGLLEP